MQDATIACPQCQHEFKLNESLAAPLLESTRKEFEKKLQEKEQQFHQREEQLRAQQAEIERKELGINEKVAAQIKKERAAIASAEEKKAKELLRLEMDEKQRQVADLQGVLKEREGKLAEAQKAQADLVKMQRELQDKEREIDLTIQKRISESSEAIRLQAKRQAEDELKLKVTEKELQIKAMQDTIEELKRKAEQGSQQTQGEALEFELESTLRTNFPHDTIEPVAKGEFGGDVLQHVFHGAAQRCGSILWETKRTKTWSDLWLSKLRDNQRTAQAELAIIVSQVLPKGIEIFGLKDEVWVTSPRTLIPVTIALRQSLIELAHARQSQEGLQTKMGMVYQYLTGTQFKQRMQAIVEAFTSMQDDLAKEQKSIKKHWAYREKQLQQVLESSMGVVGDVQGIAGKQVLELEGLEMPALEE